MYCPRCGTNNREGSKFCNNCGTQLTPPADITCPACGTANPLNTAFCNNCGARLVSLGAARPEPKPTAPPVKGLSLPTKGKPSPPEPPAYVDTTHDREEGKDIPETGSAQEPATPFGADIPDWLAQLRAVPPAEEETSAPPVSNDMPDWIRQLQSVQPEETAPEPVPPAEPPPAPPGLPTEATGLPAWLTPSGESSWLPQQEPTEPATRPIDGQPAPSGEIPSALPVPPSEEFPSALPPEPAQAGMRPTAQSSIPFPAEERTAEEMRADTSISESGPPDWLQGLQTREPTPSEATALEETTPLPQNRSELPDWLVAGTTGEKQPNLEEIPEWLRMAMPVEKPEEAAPEEPAAEPSVEPVYRAPDSSASRQRLGRLPAGASTPGAEPLEEGNLLAGLRGVLPLAVAVAEPHMLVEKPATVAVTEKDDGARLFEAILSEAPAEAEPLPVRKADRALTMRPIIYLMLALAVIVPFFFPRGVAGSLLRISKTPAADVYDLIQALPSGSTVLVAFDYEASVAGEMNVLATAMVRHLVQRHIKIIAVSTFDIGPEIAQRVISSAISSDKDYRYGAEYLNFGYIPGHEAGLASLAANGFPPNKDYGQRRDIRQYPITLNIKSPNDVALIIELAGSEEPLRMWMEQVQPRIRTRIIGGVSAAVEPKAQVYKRPGQLAGLVSGLMGAAQYEILSNQPGQALTSMNAQSAAQIVLILIILVGNVVHWIGRAGGHVRTKVSAEKAK